LFFRAAMSGEAVLPKEARLPPQPRLTTPHKIAAETKAAAAAVKAALAAAWAAASRSENHARTGSKLKAANAVTLICHNIGNLGRSSNASGKRQQQHHQQSFSSPQDGGNHLSSLDRSCKVAGMTPTTKFSQCRLQPSLDILRLFAKSP